MLKHLLALWLNFVQITTDYNFAESCSECYALQQFSAGDQVYTCAIAQQPTNASVALCDVVVQPGVQFTIANLFICHSLILSQNGKTCNPFLLCFACTVQFFSDQMLLCNADLVIKFMYSRKRSQFFHEYQEVTAEWKCIITFCVVLNKEKSSILINFFSWHVSFEGCSIAYA